MALLHQGGCRCGFARYEIDMSDAHTMNCHCTDCQKHLGAPFSVFTIVKASQFQWLGEPSGRIQFSAIATRRFCTHCGTYLKWESTENSEEAEINTMTLDTLKNITIDEEIYVRTRLSWIRPIEGVPQYEASRVKKSVVD